MQSTLEGSISLPSSRQLRRAQLTDDIVQAQEAASHLHVEVCRILSNTCKSFTKISSRAGRGGARVDLLRSRGTLEVDACGSVETFCCCSTGAFLSLGNKLASLLPSGGGPEL